jgi:hypothetical protein
VRYIIDTSGAASHRAWWAECRDRFGDAFLLLRMVELLAGPATTALVAPGRHTNPRLPRGATPLSLGRRVT